MGTIFDFLRKSKWKALLGLLAVWVAVAMNWNWIWGIIFLVWAFRELRDGRAFFIEEVERFRNPMTFWFIIVSWIVLSLYLLITAISPKLNPESPEFLGYASAKKYISLVQEPSKCSLLPSVGLNGLDIKGGEKDTLRYRICDSEVMCFIGYSVKILYKNGDYRDEIKKAWNYFYEKDFPHLVKNKIDDQVFVIYSDLGNTNTDSFRITIGYRTSIPKKLNKKLSKVFVPASKFGILTTFSEDEDAIHNLWNKVNNSDLQRKKDFDMEVYQFDKDFKIFKSELWVSLK